MGYRAAGAGKKTGKSGKTGRTPGRPGSRWQATEQALRQDIVDGVWPTDAKLPTYDELEVRYSLSRLMLQQAVRRLKQDGFVIGRERQGLFVNAAGPHRSRLGLLLPQDPGATRFWRELDKAARAVCAGEDKTLATYAALAASAEETARLGADVAAFMVTGLLVPFDPADMPELAPALAAPRVPCAVFDCRTPAANLLPVTFDNQGLAARGVAWLAAQGVRRVAYLGNFQESRGIAAAFAAEAERAGLTAPAAWRFPIYLENLGIVEKIVALLLSLPAGERPEGLFIGDDNLTAAVMRGILARGARVPEDLRVVSHCNWPAEDLAPLPVRYFGYDLGWLVAEVLRRFAAFHAGAGLGEPLVVPALAAEELRPVSGRAGARPAAPY